jgi:hypothetical protein
VRGFPADYGQNLASDQQPKELLKKEHSRALFAVVFVIGGEHLEERFRIGIG